MNTARPTTATFVAALLLGALMALLVATPARSAEPFRLDRVGMVRFTASEEGKLQRQTGILHRDGRIAARFTTEIVRPANTPAWALDRALISVDAWHHYRALGTDALSNFKLLGGGAWFSIGEERFLLVAHDEEATTAGGRLSNLSTRSRVAPGAGTDHAVTGFVIEDQPRIVLIRAVGPTLQRFGIGSWLSDPVLNVRRSDGRTSHTNDNWPFAAEADAIRLAATRVGAFPLDEDSADAARLVELAPGAYNILVTSADPNARAGDVLIEIYSVPDNLVMIPAGSTPATAAH